METNNLNYDFYLNNYFSVLEELLRPDFIPKVIKETFLPHVFSKIRQFAESHNLEEERMEFVNYLFDSLNDTKLKLSDINDKNIGNRYDLVKLIELEIKSVFSDLKIEKKNQHTTSEKIIILEYLGILKLLNDSNISQKDQVEILSILLEKSKENIKKDISKVAGKIFEKESVKNRISLNAVKETAMKLKNKILIDKVNADLESLSKNK